MGAAPSPSSLSSPVNILNQASGSNPTATTPASISASEEPRKYVFKASEDHQDDPNNFSPIFLSFADIVAGLFSKVSRDTDKNDISQQATFSSAQAHSGASTQLSFYNYGSSNLGGKIGDLGQKITKTLDDLHLVGSYAGSQGTPSLAVLKAVSASSRSVSSPSAGSATLPLTSTADPKSNLFSLSYNITVGKFQGASFVGLDQRLLGYMASTSHSFKSA